MIEYIDECHTYLSDGVIIPSVSQLVQYATQDDYSNIPSYILKQAQDFGTSVHHAIENYLTKDLKLPMGTYETLCFKQFKKLYKDFISEPICELMVDYNERYGGRIDCLSKDILIDFKTNTNLNIPHLEWQMGFYKLALESKGTEIKECKCLWLPKRKSGKWVDITPKTKEECLKILEEYERSVNE